MIDEHDPPTYVELPPEDPDSKDKCARLLRHMYDTWMAADGWQEEYSSLLVTLGFLQCMGVPNVLSRKERGIMTSVHRDVFTSCGPKTNEPGLPRAGDREEARDYPWTTIGTRI